mmetsp:Transcript_29426/g.49501  ORF Transcript_29426/g.49501 Transcript_29426/m.49501 type:complete len:817 (+) Transcript_29426:2-2452(+)
MHIRPLGTISLPEDAKEEGSLLFSSEHGEALNVHVLEDDIVRVSFYPEGKPKLDRTWIVLNHGKDIGRSGRDREGISNFTRPLPTLKKSAQSIELSTAKLNVEVNFGGASAGPHIQWKLPSGQVFASDLRSKGSYFYDRRSRDVFHYLERRYDERYYGFGERSGELDKRGRRMRMVNVDALGYDAETSDPLYKHYPFYITFVEDLGIAYGILYDTYAHCTFDMGNEIDAYHGPYRYFHGEDGDVDYYLLFGPTVEQVTEKLARLTGYMCMPPKYSLGYLASTMLYTEAQDAQRQLLNFLSLCKKHDVPCSMFHVSSGYTSGADGKRYVFEWNKSKVPDPEYLVNAFHAANIRLCPNVKPCLLLTHPQYTKVADMNGFIHSAEDGKADVSHFWGGKGSYLDFTGKAYDWWKSMAKERLLKFGMDALWNDNNEYEIWDDEAYSESPDGTRVRIGVSRPLHPLLMARASYEALQEHRPQQRPFVISRSASLGMQRYAQTWSGDNLTSWKTLKFNIPMGLGLSLSGMPNFGHDVGGFAGKKPDAELLVRWVQNGIFHPRLTLHSWHEDGSVNEPWMYPEVLPIIRKWIKFRYSLIPYIYSLFYEASTTGHPIIRPMCYHFTKECPQESFDFMLGPSLLVASVVEPGCTSRKVYLPRGSGERPLAWCDVFKGDWYLGGQTVSINSPLDQIPLFAPAGVVLYFEPSPNVREIHVFSPPVSLECSSMEQRVVLYEDDGISNNNHVKSEFTLVACAIERMSELAVAVSVDVRNRSYKLPYQKLDIVLPVGDTRAVEFKGGILRSHTSAHLAGAVCASIMTSEIL